jgi:hypothetical protein
MDNKLVVTAAAQHQKAADYVLGVERRGPARGKGRGEPLKRRTLHGTILPGKLLHSGHLVL